jgi:hypothetical protein
MSRPPGEQIAFDARRGAIPSQTHVHQHALSPNRTKIPSFLLRASKRTQTGATQPGRACHHVAMSMAELMRTVAGLPMEQQSELAAFLSHLRLRNDPAWRSEMTTKIDGAALGNGTRIAELIPIAGPVQPRNA